MIIRVANPTLSKVTTGLGLAGSDARSPILVGLSGTLRAVLQAGEAIASWTITAPGGFSNSLVWTDLDDGAEVDIVFGVDTKPGSPGDAAVRNELVLATNLGTTRRNLWTKQPPTEGALYVNNQECQDGTATVRVRPDDPNVDARKATPSINILPVFGDEFFGQQEYSGNRWANTRRGWGGAATAEIEVGGVTVLAETAIARVHGFEWTPPSQGLHTIMVYLRAKAGSASYATLVGTLDAQPIGA